MITLNLIGEMGNQMFEYAYARALSKEFDDKDIEINPYFSKYFNLFVYKSFKMTSNSLKHLYLNENVKEIEKKKGMRKGLLRCFDYTFHDSYVLHRRLTTKKGYYDRSKKGIYQMTEVYPYFCHSNESKKNKQVLGYFQNEKYFINVKEILMNELRVKTKPSEKNLEKMKELDSCNSVCVHIRRGDYLAPQYSHLNICSENYYQRGMDYIEEHVEKPVFYVFSNTKEEIRWVQENYHFTQKLNYVDLSNPAYEDLRLMYHCKHFVISNSTFSWWGSYLSRNKKKVIVAPSVWARESDRMSGAPMEIYRNDMVKIDID